MESKLLLGPLLKYFVQVSLSEKLLVNWNRDRERDRDRKRETERERKERDNRKKRETIREKGGDGDHCFRELTTTAFLRNPDKGADVEASGKDCDDRYRITEPDLVT